MITTIVMAADVITKKNGTTIQCKVIKVGRTEVEYKNITNLNGPVYAIDLTEISSIKYENGGTDKFGEQSVITNNAGQRSMTDGELMRMYNNQNESYKKQGKIYKILAYSVAGIGIVSSALLVKNADHPDAFEKYVPACVGVVSGITLYLVGNYKVQQAKRFDVMSLFMQDIKLNNNSVLIADVNIINDNITHDKSLGMGLRFTF